MIVKSLPSLMAPPIRLHRPVVRLLSSAALLWMAASCAAADPVPTGHDDEAAVVEAITSYYDAFSSRDWDRFSAHFWDGAILATLWPPPGEEGASVFVSSVPEYVRRAPEGPDSQPIFEEVMEGIEVRVHGDLAMAWANYRARFGTSEDLLEWRGVDAFTLLRHRGEWRIVSLAYVGE